MVTRPWIFVLVCLGVAAPPALAVKKGKAADAGSAAPDAGTAAAQMKFKELASIVDTARSEVEGRSCESRVVEADCTLRYRTTCHGNDPAPWSFWYEVAVPLAALDLEKTKTGEGLSEHPGHVAVRWVTRGNDLRVTTGSGRNDVTGEASLALGKGPDAVKRAEALPALLSKAASTCR